MKKIKVFSFFLALCILLHLVQIPLFTKAKDDVTEHHFVILFDVSSSMNDVDKYHQLNDQIEVFLNYIPKKYYPIKIMILPFAGSCPAVNDMVASETQAWWEIPEYIVNVLSPIEEKIHDLEYNKEYTNIEMALATCVEKLNDMKSGVKSCEQTVLFITDGLPDLPGTGAKKFQDICDSYDNIMKLAENFPDNVSFLAITPDTSNLGNDVKYGESDGKTIVEIYYNYCVPKEYAEKMVDVVRCMENFCEKVSQKRSSSKYPVSIHQINWQGANFDTKIKEEFNNFYEKIFNTYSTETNDLDLTEGVSFRVPQTVDEIDVNISFNESDMEKVEQIIKECVQNIQITKDDKEFENRSVSKTKKNVIVKLINPDSGIYKITCKDITSANLNFISHGALKINNLNGTWNGEEIIITGEILNGDNKKIPENEMQYIKYFVNSENSGLLSDIVNESGKLEIHVIPKGDGENEVKIMFQYNDVNIINNPMGVCEFTTKEEEIVVSCLPITVPPSTKPVTSSSTMPIITTQSPDNIDKNPNKYIYISIAALLFFIVVLCIVKRNRSTIKITIYKSGRKLAETRVKNTGGYVTVSKVSGLQVKYDREKEKWIYKYENNIKDLKNNEIDLR